MRTMCHLMAAVLLLSLGFQAICSDPILEAPLLTPDLLVEQVLTRNPNLAALDAAADAAVHRIDPAGALDDPVLFYGFAPETANGDPPGRGLNQRLEISQAFPWPGKRRLSESRK